MNLLWLQSGGCGGCDWQHTTAAHQRDLKTDVVREQLRRLAGYEWTGQVERLPGDDDGAGGAPGWAGGRGRVSWPGGAGGRGCSDQPGADGAAGGAAGGWLQCGLPPLPHDRT